MSVGGWYVSWKVVAWLRLATGPGCDASPILKPRKGKFSVDCGRVGLWVGGVW